MTEKIADIVQIREPVVSRTRSVIKRVMHDYFYLRSQSTLVCVKQATTNSVNEASRAQIFTRAVAQKQCRYEKPEKRGAPSPWGAVSPR